MDTVEDIFAEVLKLAMAAGLPLVVTIGLLVAAAVILVMAKKIRIPGSNTPPGDSRDDSTRAELPDSTWGRNDGPPGGGMEGG